MFKRKFNFALYALALANVACAIKEQDFGWLFIVTMILTAATLVLDIVEGIKNGRK